MKIRNIPLKTTQSPCWNQGVNNCALGCHCWRLDQGQGGKEEALPEGLQPTEEVPSWWRQAYTNRRRTLLLCQVPQVWSEIFIFPTLQSLLYDQECMQGWTSFNLKSLCRRGGLSEDSWGGVSRRMGLGGGSPPQKFFRFDPKMVYFQGISGSFF